MKSEKEVKELEKDMNELRKTLGEMIIAVSEKHKVSFGFVFGTLYNFLTNVDLDALKENAENKKE